jgi:hypothetical protein
MQPGSSSALFLAQMRTHSNTEPTYDVNLLRKAIKEAKYADAPRFAPAIKQSVETLKSRPSFREIYIITDGQSLAWKN